MFFDLAMNGWTLTRPGFAKRGGLCLLLLIAGLLQACGPVPKPFRTSADEKAELSLVHQRADTLVYVAPLDTEDADAWVKADAAAALLRETGVIASSRRGRENGHLLRLTAPSAAGDLWTLFGPSGALIEAFLTPTLSNQALESARAGEFDLAMQTFAPLADGVPKAIGVNVEPTDIAIGPTTIAVARVTGARGDGERTLATAMQETLRQNGATVEEDGEADLNLIGEVSTREIRQGVVALRIVWRVETASGDHVADLAQENPVASDYLDGPWGPLAWDVAYAATPGVLDVIDAFSQTPPPE